MFLKSIAAGMIAVCAVSSASAASWTPENPVIDAVKAVDIKLTAYTIGGETCAVAGDYQELRGVHTTCESVSNYVKVRQYLDPEIVTQVGKSGFVTDVYQSNLSGRAEYVVDGEFCVDSGITTDVSKGAYVGSCEQFADYIKIEDAYVVKSIAATK